MVSGDLAFPVLLLVAFGIALIVIKAFQLLDERRRK